MNRNKRFNIRKKILENIDIVLLTFITLIVFLIFTMINLREMNHLDSDIVAEMNFAEQVWKQKTLFPSYWFYGNELSTIRPATLAAFIYGISKKFVFSYSMSLVLTMIGIYISYIYMMKAIGIRTKSILLGAIFLVGGLGYSFTSMIFLNFGYAGFYLIFTFLTIGFSLRIIKKDNIYLKKTQFITYLIISCIFGAMGIRMTVLLYFPLLISCIFMYYYFKLIDNDTLDKTVIGLSIILLIANIMGLIINQLYFIKSGYLSVNIASTKFDFIENIGENLSMVIPKLCQSIGAMGNISIVSIKGIDFGIKLLLIIMCIYGIVFCFKKNNKIKIMLISFFTISLLITVGLQVFSTMDMLPRYFILLGCLISIMISILSDTIMKSNFRRRYLIYLGITILILINIASYFPMKSYDAAQKKVEEYLVENNIEYAYATYWKAGVIKALSDGKINMIHIDPFITKENADNLHLFKWQTDEKLALSMQNSKEIIFVIDDDEEKLLLENRKSILNELENEKIAKIENYNIYKIFSNPFIELNMPGLNESITYYPSQKFINKSDNVTIKDNSIVSNGDAGYFMYGPYKDIPYGTYNFTVKYKIISRNSDNIGYIDICENGGKDILKRINLDNNSSEMVLQGVTFNDSKSVEIRGYSEVGSIIEIESISIYREK